jgi:hypothetical protein
VTVTHGISSSPSGTCVTVTHIDKGGLYIMAFVPIPGTAQIQIQYLLDNQKIENILYAVKSTSYGEGDLTTLATDVLAWAIDPWMPLFSNRLSLVRVVCRDMSSDTGPEMVATPGTATVGGINSVNLPNNVTFAVHKVSNIGGKHSKARLYLPCLTAGNLTSANTIFTSDADAFVDALSDLIGVVFDSGDNDAVLSFVTLVADGEPLTIGEPHPIIGWSYTDTTLDAQRRRLPRRGQ